MPALAIETTSTDIQPVKPIEIETVSDYQSFLDLEPVWSTVLRASSLDHPFVEHAWIRTWWECFGKGSELRVLLAKEGDQVIAIAPLILSRVRIYGMPVRRLGFLYNSHVPRAEFIISARPGAVYRAIWRHLSALRDWDVLQLSQLPAGCETAAELGALAKAHGCQTAIWKSGASPYINLNQSWDSYYNTLAAKHRANLRNRLKRMKQVGSVELEDVTSGETLPEALQAGFRIEAAGWKGKTGTAISCDRNVETFYRVLAERAVERGWLRLQFLRTGGKLAAFKYSLCYDDQLFLLKVGYDPAYAPYSPSNLLLALVLEQAFQQGLTKYDFLGESGNWKLAWSNAAVTNHWLFVFPATLKGRLLFFLKFHMIPLLKRAGLGKK